MATIRRTLQLPNTASDEEVKAKFNDRITHLKNEINNWQKNKTSLLTDIHSANSELNYLSTLMPKKDNPRWIHGYICSALELSEEEYSDTINTTYNTKIEQLNKYKEDLTNKVTTIEYSISDNQKEIGFLNSLHNKNSYISFPNTQYFIHPDSFNFQMIPGLNLYF